MFHGFFEERLQDEGKWFTPLVNFPRAIPGNTAIRFQMQDIPSWLLFSFIFFFTLPNFYHVLEKNLIIKKRGYLQKYI